MTTQIDFYLLPTSEPKKFLAYTCRLIEKAFRQGLSILLHTDQSDLLKQLDDALWQFQPDSFLAHDICVEKPTNAPILLSTKTLDSISQDICINLSDKPFEDFGYYKRLIQIINNDKISLDNAREQFRFYQQQNVKPNTIDLRKK